MKKTFDCVAFLDAAAEHTRQRLSDLAVPDQVAYWRRRNEEVLAEQERILKENTDAPEFRFVSRLETLRKQKKAFDCVEMKHQAQERLRT